MKTKVRERGLPVGVLRTHHKPGYFYYRTKKNRPAVAFGPTEPGTAAFKACLGLAKHAEKQWLAYIERKMREMLK